MIPYEGYKIYGPYKRKDGRSHVVAYKSQKDKITISYPKYLMEISTGKYLPVDKDVHHIDGDFANNAITNLKIIDRIEHRRNHAQIFKSIKLNCLWCNTEIELTALQHRRLKSNMRNKRSTGPFCSRSCTGNYGSNVQKNMPQ